MAPTQQNRTGPPETVVIKDRYRELRDLQEKGLDPFKIRKFEKTDIELVLKEYEFVETGEDLVDKKVSVAGRVKSKRVHGKAGFAHIEDVSGKIQLYFKHDTLGPDMYKIYKKRVNVGDILGVKGHIFRTHKGELSVWVEEFYVLAKNLRPLPSEWFGLKDIEKRYKQRYLDFIMNPKARMNMYIVGKMLEVAKRFLVERKFLEVITPTLQPIYGGAFARPFKTHHHYLDIDMYLRISPELYLKRLIVGGIERVFEFSKCFRNEDVDATHNPEFTQIELYWAYADFNDIMELTENMTYEMVKEIFGKDTITYQGKEINFRPPWKRMRMVDAIKEYSGIDVLSLSDEELRKVALENDIEEDRKGKILEELFDKFVLPNIVQPTFITHYPKDITPLAKESPDLPGFVERFEGFLAGMEFCNAYTELNDPIEQYKRFKEEEELRKKLSKVKGKEELEYMPMDRDFIRALEYGMPPTGGLGYGIERVAMVLADEISLKEVIAFPTVIPDIDIKNIPEIVDDK